MTPSKRRVYQAVKAHYSRRVRSSRGSSRHPSGSGCCSTNTCFAPNDSPGARRNRASKNSRPEQAADIGNVGCCSNVTSCCVPTPNDGLAGQAMGCGAPLDMIELKEGQIVLDIGCGAGREALEAARRVGPTGKVYGLDMNEDMLALARENMNKLGVKNADFIQGTMEDIPLQAEAVDVVISNCVINLSYDKDKALSEIFRVLKPGGLLAVSDTVLDGKPDEAAVNNMELWCSCVSGSMQVDEYAERLSKAGFVDVSVQVTAWHGEVDGLGQGVRLDSAFVSARKPE